MDDLTKRMAELFSQDHFATQAAGIQVEEVKEHYARCSMKIQPIHRNANGAVMGGAIFTLADYTFALASNALAPSCVTMDAHISFLGLCRGERLVAETSCLKAGKRIASYQITIKDDLDNLVANAEVNGISISDKSLEEMVREKEREEKENEEIYEGI